MNKDGINPHQLFEKVMEYSKEKPHAVKSKSTVYNFLNGKPVGLHSAVYIAKACGLCLVIWEV